MKFFQWHVPRFNTFRLAHTAYMCRYLVFSIVPSPPYAPGRTPSAFLLLYKNSALNKKICQVWRHEPIVPGRDRGINSLEHSYSWAFSFYIFIDNGINT